MNIKKIFFRDEQETSVDAYDCWEVRWTSRYGGYSYDTKPEVRVFPKKAEAEAFKKALDDAFKLIRHTSGKRTVLSKQDA